MTILDQVSIRNKIITIILCISFFIIGIGVMVSTLNYIFEIKDEALSGMTIHARLISKYCSSSLSINDSKTAEKILLQLKSIPRIISGQIYDLNNTCFAFYSQSGEIAPLPLFNSNTFFLFEGDYLHIIEPIMHNHQKIGTLYLKTDTHQSLKIKNHLMIMFWITIGLIILAYALASGFQKIISEPILNLASLTDKISQGDYSLRIEKKSRYEMGRLYKAFNRMLNEIQKRNFEIEQQNVLKTAQTELSKKIRGIYDIQLLGDTIIKFVVKFVDAQIGAIYNKDDSNQLHLIGRYAWAKIVEMRSEFSPGEGLIGQALLDKHSILLEQCPENYEKIYSALGGSSPKYILIYPFIKDNVVKAVLEVASLNEFNELHKIFLDQVSESIVVALQSVESRHHLSKLLEQTQKQAEELRIREEELRKSNEELENKNALLEEQKMHIETKNNELEIARKIGDEKAKELKLTNKYKSDFLANISHELRTPLNSIIILSKLLISNEDNNLLDDQIDSVKSIHTSGLELLNLINEVLDLSKIEAGKMDLHIEEISIQEFVNTIIQEFKAIAKDKNLEFIIHVSEDLPQTIQTDRQRLKQIIQNFLSNAFKFTDVGHVKLTVSRPFIDEKLLKKIAQSKLDISTSIMFSVIDTGIGISKENQKIIFEAFQQEDSSTSRQYGGTGLGLSIARELSTLLGGGILLKSAKGKGSTFTLFIPEKIKSLAFSTQSKIAPQDHQLIQKINALHPITQPDDDSEIDTCPPFPKHDDDRDMINAKDKDLLIIEDNPLFTKKLKHNNKMLKGKTVLLVDDDMRCLFSLKKVLTDYMIETIIAKNGLEAIEKLNTNPKIHIVLMDIMLPQMDGFETIQTIRKDNRFKDLPIIAFTAKAMNEEKSKCMACGANDYLSKPINLDQLFSLLHIWLCTPQPLSESPS